jgi:hypothetical protein
LIPRFLAAAANGASFLMGDAGIFTLRSEILGIKQFLKLIVNDIMKMFFSMATKLHKNPNTTKFFPNIRACFRL